MYGTVLDSNDSSAVHTQLEMIGAVHPRHLRMELHTSRLIFITPRHFDKFLKKLGKKELWGRFYQALPRTHLVLTTTVLLGARRAGGG